MNDDDDYFPTRSNADDDYFDFEREAGKVHVSSSMIFNGVCVKWVGILDLQVAFVFGSIAVVFISSAFIEPRD